jgi:hypothetical protein
LKYLTFLDYTTLEARGKSIEANLQEKDREITALREKYDTDITLLKEAMLEDEDKIRKTVDIKTQEFEAKIESKTQELAIMQGYIQDMHSKMSKLTKDFNMLKEMRDKDLEVLHQLLLGLEKPDNIGRGKELTIRFERTGAG